MKAIRKPIFNIAIIGGGDACVDLLRKTMFEYGKDYLESAIIGVADPDPGAPGMVLAEKLGLLTFRDYKDFYDPGRDVQLLIVLDPDPSVLDEVLQTRPVRIRILSARVFSLFWNAIGHEEQKLRKRNEEIETILNGIQDLILVIDPDFTVLDVNEAFLKKMRVTREETVGRKCYEAFRLSEKGCAEENLPCPVREALRSGMQCRQIRVREKPDGETRHFEVTIHPVFESGGGISKFIHIARDITRRVMEEEEITSRLEGMVRERTRQLHETHSRLLHKDKMASLGKLAASVVHEINNPIAGILNFVILMKRIVDEGGFGRESQTLFSRYLGLMETETRRAGKIVSNLLAFSRQSKMELSRIDVNPLIEKTLALNSNMLKIRSVSVQTKMGPDLPPVMASSDQLQQVFVNLISNAAESMEPGGGGVLEIGTAFDPAAGEVRIAFKDSGPGISERNRQKLFEPFFTTKSDSKGVGLGLSVAYGIVHDHGGKIEVESREGEGSVFTVEFPAAEV
ncbi:conserved hypothetical protein [Candidatus Desulfarcum epimagneticum]|uniref:histidine kinase n=1 Tax=uncultured Desulfobacteraceae bacterium TaxID=218296 RepID=A0A484HGJ9_9BACT|nr:conserved hypothetical protein [uncultured Desulfobacteraceae bacterium]